LPPPPGPPTPTLLPYTTLFRSLPEVRFPRRASVRQFDDLYTAPHGGFADALDYYRRCSSFPLIPRIPIPALLLTARDDPFIAVRSEEHTSELQSLAYLVCRLLL